MPHGDQRDDAQGQLFSLAVWSHSKAACSADVVLMGIFPGKNGMELGIFLTLPVGNPSPDQRANPRPSGQNNQRNGICGGHHRRIESRRSPCLDRSHEQHSKPYREARSSGADLGDSSKMNVLEELWYGNLESSKFNSSPRKEYKELLHLVGRNEEKLLATMTAEQEE